MERNSFSFFADGQEFNCVRYSNIWWKDAEIWACLKIKHRNKEGFEFDEGKINFLNYKLCMVK